MSLIRPGFWYPQRLDYYSDPLDPLASPTVVLDYPSAALVCALGIGIQIHLAIPILQGAQLGTSRRRRHARGLSIVLLANAALAIAFIVTATLYCVGFLVKLQSLGGRQKIVRVGEPEVPRHLTLGERVVLQMMAVGMQFMVLLADTLLIYRCWVVFHGKKWICAIPVIPYCISLALSIYGVVSVAQHPTQEEFTSYGEFITVELVAPYVSAAASFFVNFIVTTSICVHILRTRRRVKALVGESRSTPSDTLFAVAIIVEAALPASCTALYVPLATFFTFGGVYASRVAWVVCTALAPQLIAVRVMKRRDIHSVCQRHEEATSIEFVEITDGGGGRAARSHSLEP